MPYLLLAVSVSFMAMPAILVRYAEASVEALGAWRMLLAVAALLPLAWPKRSQWRALAPHEKRVAALSGAFFFVHLWLFTYAARSTSVAHCMLAFSTHPLFTALGARLFFGAPLKPRTAAAFVLAAAGMALLAADRAGGAATLRGDLAALGSAAGFSAYVLCGQSARRRLDNSVFAVAAYAACGLCFLAAGLGTGSAFSGYSGRGWAAILGLGLGVTLLGHALFTHLFAELDVQAMSLAKLLEPPAAAFAARALFGEPVGGRTFAAFALLAGAVVLALSASGAPPRRSGSAPPA